jgi:hypothetical protein
MIINTITNIAGTAPTIIARVFFAEIPRQHAITHRKKEDIRVIPPMPGSSKSKLSNIPARNNPAPRLDSLVARA